MVNVDLLAGVCLSVEELFQTIKFQNTVPLKNTFIKS